ncbi:MAG TPA: PrsW family glutamic-type intramembrane protease [bacterium]|nr:PrsW family glutamic-type intramembrane protease [bacterium]
MWLFALAIAPGVFWVWYFRRRDHLRPEPRHLVGRVFVIGGLAAIAAVFLEALAFRAAGIDLSDSFVPSTALAALIIGAVEESAKLGALYLSVFRHAHFDEVMDGILYAVTASLGFATVENIGYVLQGGADVAILRAVLSVPGHAFFGAVMGFYVGVAKFAGRSGPLWFFGGLLLAAAAHAAYDAAIFTGTWVALTIIPFIFLLWRASLHYVRRALAIDDERLGKPLAAARRIP